MKTLGIDIGSSSVKVAILDIDTGQCCASVQSPEDQELPISAPHKGWAEQDPEMWWQHVQNAIKKALINVQPDSIQAIGITYQMHGLVCLDKSGKSLRPSIIWCDSRAVPYGQKALSSIGEKKCLENVLNSPGNFTASKLAWIKEQEPETFNQISHFVLPGDYIALKLTGEITTTPSGLSEGILWNFKEEKVADFVLDYYGIPHSMLPTIVPQFGNQGSLLSQIASELGLKAGIPVTYRAGDQPNNAFSLNVLNPGEVAATAGTSGVVYGVTDQISYDPRSRVNTFVHVNHTPENPRLGILLCINGTGCLNSWVRKTIAPGLSYDQINRLAAEIQHGSDLLSILPFGNGAERMLENKEPGCVISGLNFNIHGRNHLLRAAQEGIAFAFKYGMDVMENMGMNLKVIRAGKANLFLSPIFRETLSSVTGAVIELYDTDGALGAARGAALGAGFYASTDEAFKHLNVLKTTNPQTLPSINEAFDNWKNVLSHNLK